jgi:3-deoxy-D-manno-octulosonate 8-phosphate phosphatase (KDO 8-P phosphatase)
MDRMVRTTIAAGPLRAPPLARELRWRAANLRLVITDVDGTLTDGTTFYTERGEAMKRFSMRDGMGVERLRDDGIETAFLTRETSPIVARRAEKLRIRWLYQGVRDKRAALDGILADVGCTRGQAAFIGDDVNDLEILVAVSEQGLVAAPLDADPLLLRAAHHRCVRPGGAGAFRDFADWILELRHLAHQPEMFPIRLVGDLTDEKEVRDD